MSEKISEDLFSVLQELSSVEVTYSKADAALFAKRNEELMKEKIAYLYNLLDAEAGSYNKKADSKFDAHISKIMDKYREKLDAVYDELYLQYISVQSEISSARVNEKVILINYQRAVNNSEITGKSNNEIKRNLKNKYDIYEKIINRCKDQFENCKTQMEVEINKSFLISSDLQVIDENGFFNKLIRKITNFFSGSKKFEEKLDGYEGSIDYIDSQRIVQDIREQTIEFVTDILEIKDVELGKDVVKEAAV